jgi:carboxylesterase
MRPLGEAFAGAGWSVEVIRLPGHGTSVDDMLSTTWDDWSSAAASAFDDLRARCDDVVVVGQSMGGSLALWLAGRRPMLTGLVCINPAVLPQAAEAIEMVEGMLAEGETVIPGSGSDIADPDVVSSSYDCTPLAPLVSLSQALAALEPDLDRITAPLLLCTSLHDHVVDPAQSDHLAAHYGGPIERLVLKRGYHVATLDFDRDLLRTQVLSFAHKLTGA